jgi:hypothetical protein
MSIYFVLIILHVQSLRDMKSSCEKLPLEQVSSLIEKDPHPQLW